MAYLSNLYLKAELVHFQRKNSNIFSVAPLLDCGGAGGGGGGGGVRGGANHFSPLEETLSITLFQSFFNSIAFRKTKTVYNFWLSECNRGNE